MFLTSGGSGNRFQNSSGLDETGFDALSLCGSGKNSTVGANSLVKRADSTLLKPVADLDSQPVLFIPDVYFGNLQRAGQVRNNQKDTLPVLQ